MLYVAELTMPESNLVDRMHEMRTWLDHRHIEPTMFRVVAGEVSGECRVVFGSEADAAAFAAEFGGEVLAVAGVMAEAVMLNSRSASSSVSGRARPS